jgi:hypothetical protein
MIQLLGLDWSGYLLMMIAHFIRIRIFLSKCNCSFASVIEWLHWFLFRKTSVFLQKGIFFFLPRHILYGLLINDGLFYSPFGTFIIQFLMSKFIEYFYNFFLI